MSATYFPCEEVCFEIDQGNELLVGFSKHPAAKKDKTFFTPLSASGKFIGWIEFDYVFKVHGKFFYKAIRLHQEGDVSPDASNIWPLLSTPHPTGSPFK
jgi:hypothetical protein